MDRMDAGLYDKGHRSQPVVNLDDVRRLQDIVGHVYMDRALMLYASELVAVTRTPDEYLPRQLARLVEYGGSPRATIAFCRALALLSGRAHFIPDDIERLAHRVLRHRLILGFEAASSGITPETIIDGVLQAVRVP